MIKCKECKGDLIKEKVFHIIDGAYLFKEVPAMVCKRCGEEYLDTRASLELEDLADVARAYEVEVLIMTYKP